MTIVSSFRPGHRWLPVILLSLAPVSAWALSIGEIEVFSKLNEPFDARVLIRGDEGDFTNLNVRLADADTYRKAGLDHGRVANFQLNFELERGINGKDYILVQSRLPVREPIVTLLLRVETIGGSILREYAVLLDYEPGGDKRPATAGTVPAVELPVITRSPDARGEGAPTPIAVPPKVARAVRGRPGQDYLVQGGDTLWAIALSMRPDRSVSIQQMMLALLRTNPDAFFLGGNINALRKGVVLRPPSADALNALSRTQAVAQVRVHNSRWSDYKSGRIVSAPAPAPAAPGAQPTTVAPVTAKTPAPGAVRPAPATPPPATPAPAPVAPEAAPPSPPPQPEVRVVGVQEGGASQGAGTLADLERRLSLTEESIASKDRELEELSSRLLESEEIVSDLRRIITLKDEELAAMQRRMVTAEKVTSQTGEQLARTEELSRQQIDEAKQAAEEVQRQAQEEAEQARLAAEEAQRQAQEEAERVRLAAEEAQRLAQEEATEQARLAIEAAQKQAQEEAERARLAAEEAQRQAQEQAEQARLAAEAAQRQAQEQAAMVAEQARQEAQQIAEEARLAAEEAQRLAQEQAEQARVAAEEAQKRVQEEAARLAAQQEGREVQQPVQETPTAVEQPSADAVVDPAGQPEPEAAPPTQETPQPEPGLKGRIDSIVSGLTAKLSRLPEAMSSLSENVSGSVAGWLGQMKAWGGQYMVWIGGALAVLVLGGAGTVAYRRWSAGREEVDLEDVVIEREKTDEETEAADFIEGLDDTDSVTDFAGVGEEDVTSLVPDEEKAQGPAEMEAEAIASGGGMEEAGEADIEETIAELGATEIMDLSEIETITAGEGGEGADTEAGSQIAEINVLIAYGQFDKALEMAKSLVEQQPEQVDNRLKLLEVYSAMRDVEEFEKEAATVREKTGGEGGPWEAVTNMWLDMSTGRGLFAGAGEEEEDLMEATQQLTPEMAQQAMQAVAGASSASEADAGAMSEAEVDEEEPATLTGAEPDDENAELTMAAAGGLGELEMPEGEAETADEGPDSGEAAPEAGGSDLDLTTVAAGSLGESSLPEQEAEMPAMEGMEPDAGSGGDDADLAATGEGDFGALELPEEEAETPAMEGMDLDAGSGGDDADLAATGEGDFGALELPEEEAETPAMEGAEPGAGVGGGDVDLAATDEGGLGGELYMPQMSLDEADSAADVGAAETVGDDKESMGTVESGAGGLEDQMDITRATEEALAELTVEAGGDMDLVLESSDSEDDDAEQAMVASDLDTELAVADAKEVTAEEDLELDDVPELGVAEDVEQSAAPSGDLLEEDVSDDTGMYMDVSGVVTDTDTREDATGGQELDIDIDIGETGEANEPEAAASPTTKLDLARAYIELGEVDNAVSSLQDVIREGSGSQRKEAENLLSKLR